MTNHAVRGKQQVDQKQFSSHPIYFVYPSWLLRFFIFFLFSEMKVGSKIASKIGYESGASAKPRKIKRIETIGHVTVSGKNIENKYL